MPSGPRPLKPENVRYRAAGRSPSVYLVEIGRMVKVGYSVRPDQRLQTLHKQHTRQGELLGQFLIFPNLSEERCIEVLRQNATTVPRRREYFLGIDFGTATQLLVDLGAGAGVPDGCAVHGPLICPRQPRNATQSS